MFADASERRLAIGVWATSFSVGGAIGPLIGGMLLERFEWGSVFWAGVPVIVLLLILAPMLLPEFKNPRASPMDVTSAMQSLVAVLLLIYGFKHIAATGWNSMAVISLSLGVGVGIAFVRRQGRLENPLVDLSLLRRFPFLAALLAFSFGCFVASAILFFVAQYLQQVFGFTPLRAGIWTLSGTAGFILGSTTATSIVRRFQPAHTMIAGLMLAALGLTLIAVATEGHSVALLACGLFCFSFGLAPVYITATDVMVSSVPPQRAGEASGISETGSELGAALGIAILGSIGGAAYRASISGAIPRDVPAEVAPTIRDTLGGAFALAQQLPEQVRNQVLEASRGAFDYSLHITIGICLAITILVAIAVMLLTRATASVTAAKVRSGCVDERGRPTKVA
jgi:MFS transporter, DHA2 family, multidrug resistance protein